MSPNAPIILCEGASDEAFLGKLIEGRALGDFEIRKAGEKGGHTYFRERLNGLKDLRGIENRNAIILVRDNDDDPAGAFADMQEHVRAAVEYNVPNVPRVLSARGKFPPVSILMLPWDNDPGCLETLLLISARDQHQQQARCVDQLIECVEIEAWSVSKQSKAKLRCLLSTSCENDPNVAVNWAWKPENIRDGDLISLNHTCFNRIEQYLRSVNVPSAY